MPGFPVPPHLLSLPKVMPIESAMPSNIPPCRPLLLPSDLPASGSFPASQLFASGGQSVGASASASVLPEYSGLISFKIDRFDLLAFQGTLKSPTAQLKATHSSVLCLLPCLALTSTQDCWKDHSLDQTDLCQQSDDFAF